MVEDCMRMTMPFRIPILANLLVLFSGHYIQTHADDLPSAAPKKGIAIQLETKTGKLDGTVDLPDGNGPFPVVILLPGSGPTDRDGNQPQLKNDCLKQLGEGLARKGIAVVRYDRRGVGRVQGPHQRRKTIGSTCLSQTYWSGSDCWRRTCVSPESASSATAREHWSACSPPAHSCRGIRISRRRGTKPPRRAARTARQEPTRKPKSQVGTDRE